MESIYLISGERAVSIAVGSKQGVPSLLQGLFATEDC